jgi:hypothetical protein
MPPAIRSLLKHRGRPAKHAGTVECLQPLDATLRSDSAATAQRQRSDSAATAQRQRSDSAATAQRQRSDSALAEEANEKQQVSETMIEQCLLEGLWRKTWRVS